jgi:hypothetical protein
VRSRDVVVDPGRSGNAVLKCPSGTTIVNGGGVWHRPRQDPDVNLKGRLTISFPDIVGNAWFAAGRNEGTSTLGLRVTVFCVPPSVLGADYQERDYKVVLPDENYIEYADDYLFCPDNYRVVGGGSYWSDLGSYIVTDTFATILSSGANGNGKSWYASGSMNDPHANYLVLTMVAICLPV